MSKKQLIQIKSWTDALVLFELEAVALRDVVIEAIAKNADLRSADLSSANLSYADLRSADLSSANLSSANLRYANLRSANLSSANLRYANLSSADLSSADLSSIKLSWSSHDLIARLLMEKAENVEQRKVAGLILISKDWCWEQFLKIETREREWALRILKAQKPDGMPELLEAVLKKLKD